MFAPEQFRYLESLHSVLDRLTLVDVGAADGLEDPWGLAAEKLDVVAFEPDSRSAVDVDGDGKGPKWTVYPVALGSRLEERTLYLTRKAQCSSLLPPDRSILEGFVGSERFDIVETMPVLVQPLDGVLAGHEAEIDAIKIDTQGTELEILKGGAQIVKSEVLLVQVEVEFIPLYKNQPLFGEVDGHLRTNGFDLIDLELVKYGSQFCGKADGSQRVAFGNALYFRDPGELDPSVVSPRRIAAALELARLFGQSAIALRYLSIHGQCLEQGMRERVQLELDAEARRSVNLAERRRRLKGLRRYLPSVLHRGVAAIRTKDLHDG